MSRRVVVMLGALVLAVVAGAMGYPKAEPFLTQFMANRECCRIPLSRNIAVTRAELNKERT